MSNHKLYHLTFLDHVVGIDRPLTCFLVGYLVKENKDSFVLSPWIVDDENFEKDNYELFTIIKSTIIDIYEIELAK